MDSVDRTQTAVTSAALAATKARKRKPKPKPRPKIAADLQVLTEQAAAAARLLKLVGNERRLLILCFLAANGEMRAGDLTTVTGLSQSALSQHLAKMRADGLVAFRRQSQILYYRIADRRAEQLLKSLKSIYCSNLARSPTRNRR
jgi:ArsR family transcriptional regulator, virulence genes transcriptional regulator